jgi:hypothetical protein
MHLNHYSELEIDNCWYSDDESDMMREKAEDVAECLENGMATVKERYGEAICHRGLEGLTHQGSLERRKNKDAGLDAVLDEQDLQDDEGFDDPDYIAHFYKIASCRAVAKARAIGLKDELDAMI